MGPYWKRFTEWGTASKDKLIWSARWKLVATYGLTILFVLNAQAFLQRDRITFFNETGTLIMLGAVSAIGYYFVSNRILYRIQQEIRSHTQFLSDASHELRTPLTVMKTDLEITLRHPGDKEELTTTIKDTLDEVNRMHRIVEDVLMLSRNYLMKKGEEKLQTNLNELLKDVVSKVEGYGKTKGVKVVIEKMPKQDLEIVGDRGKLLQSFLNITKNAIEFSKPSGGTVKVIVDEITEKFVNVTVQDEGIGIAVHDLPFIFNRFYQVDKSRAWREAGGSGLGLSIAKWIIVGYQGNLTAESKLGKGTKMKFKLARVVS